MSLYPASRNGPRLLVDTKAIRVIGILQMIEFMPELANLGREPTLAVAIHYRFASSCNRREMGALRLGERIEDFASGGNSRVGLP